jgi:hypothetical protein
VGMGIGGGGRGGGVEFLIKNSTLIDSKMKTLINKFKT